MEEIIISNNNIIKELSFSKNMNAFFDLWHIHYDFEGIGNESFAKKVESIEEGIRVYMTLSEKLKDYPSEFQLWIVIDEKDSSEDAVYIHSPNPNADNFPYISVKENYQNSNNNKILNFLKEQDFTIIRDENFYIVYKRGIGVDLLKK